MVERRAQWRFVRFLLVGGLNTAFGYGVFAALVGLGCAPEIGLLVATILGVLFNFFTTGRLVFGDGSARRWPRFCLVYGLVYLLNASTLRLLVGAGLSPLLAQAALTPFAVVVTFQAMKSFVFPEKLA